MPGRINSTENFRRVIMSDVGERVERITAKTLGVDPVDW